MDGSRNIVEECKSVQPRLRLIRQHLGLTQREMSARLAEVGVPCIRGNVAKLEVGIAQVTLPVALAYAAIAGITVEQLASPTPIELRTSI